MAKKINFRYVVLNCKKSQWAVSKVENFFKKRGKCLIFNPRSVLDQVVVLSIDVLALQRSPWITGIMSPKINHWNFKTSFFEVELHYNKAYHDHQEYIPVFSWTNSKLPVHEVEMSSSPWICDCSQRLMLIKTDMATGCAGK